ncbi:MYXO-CTERM sorting domain-containing protein [Nocardia sp. R7R-8]|uniref:MYXO-CTERM sorting domain-containing protein n=1 Tax=Nocardia sp. R7R-8 TaxID=3459304 RepID=UPI00403D6DDF
MTWCRADPPATAAGVLVLGLQHQLRRRRHRPQRLPMHRRDLVRPLPAPVGEPAPSAQASKAVRMDG